MTKAVENFAPKLIILTVRRALATKRHLLFQFLLLILFLGAIGGSARAGLDIQNPPAESLGAGSPFAISDFDGDLQPDLASVEAGHDNSDETDYWIQLHLSTAGQQFIRVVAPSGGLQIEARDVNGDHAIDLVISSAGRREPVAIFLNDGHGIFSRAEPDAFPGALDESGENWVSGLNLLRVALGVTPQSGSSIWPKEDVYKRQDARRSHIALGYLLRLIHSIHCALVQDQASAAVDRRTQDHFLSRVHLRPQPLVGFPKPIHIRTHALIDGQTSNPVHVQ